MPDYNIQVKLSTEEATKKIGQLDSALGKVGSRTISPKGIKTAKSDIDATTKSVDSLSRTLGRAAAAFASFVGVRQLGQLVDTFQNLENRVRAFARSEEETLQVTNDLFEVANRTRAGLETTAKLYQRIIINEKQLNVSRKEAIGFVETLNKAVAVSGASTVEAQNALLQLSQGFGGTLQGDELRAVIEQLPVLAQAIAEEVGAANIQVLRQMASEGKITGKVAFEAIQNSAGRFTELFAKTLPTLGQAFTVFNNSLLVSAGNFAKFSGAGQGIVKVILAMADNMDVLIRATLTLSTVITTVLVNKALRALSVAILANPIGALATGALAAATALIAFADKITFGSNKLITLQDYAVATFQVVAEESAKAGRAFQEGFVQVVANAGLTGVFNDIGDFFSVTLPKAFDATLLGVRNLVNKIIGYFSGLLASMGVVASKISETFSNVLNLDFNAIGIEGTGTKIANAFSQEFNRDFVGEIVSGAGDIIGGGLGKVADRAKDLSSQRNASSGGVDLGGKPGGATVQVDSDFEKLIANLREEVGLQKLSNRERDIALGIKAAENELNRDLVGTQRELVAGLLQQIQAIQDQNAFASVISNLEEENALLKLNTQERQFAIALKSAEAEAGFALNEQQTATVANLIEENAALTAKSELLNEINGPMELFIQQQEALNQLLADGSISAEQYGSKFRDLKTSVLDNNTDFASGIERGLLRLEAGFFDLGVSAESALTGAFGAIGDTFDEFVKTGTVDFRGLAQSILADLAKVALQAAAINALKGLGGGGAGGLTGLVTGALGFATGGSFTVGGSGGTDSTPVNFNATPGERVTIETPAQQSAKQAAPAPQNNVSVVNVLDKKLLQDYLQTRAGQQVLINEIQRNSRSVNGVLR